MNKKIFKCRLCDIENENNLYVAKDNHFGLSDEFNYIECLNCQTLQIENIPSDMSKYYPASYYSKIIIDHPSIKSLVKKMWYKSYSRSFNPLPAALKLIFGKIPFAIWLDNFIIELSDPILDVGSGSGNLLYHMNLAGFNDLTGIDPYIERDIIYSKELKILKADLDDLIKSYKRFKLIIYNYSFEHLANPIKTMRQSRSLQDIGDKLIIRTPTHNSFAWEKFGVHWANLDAPRHFHIFSEKSMSILAHKSAYELNKVVYDSTDFQFWLSILYQNGIPFTATQFASKNPMKDFRNLISRKDERNFRRLSKKLNEQKKGDQASFYFTAV